MNYSEVKIIKDLSKKHDVLIDRKIIKIMQHPEGSINNLMRNDVGIKTLGKIDYLVKNHFYSKTFVYKY